MTEINSKDFEVKILLNKNPDKKHTDATQPQVATKPGADGQIGKFYQVSLLAKKEGPKIVQGKKIIFNIWNGGQRGLIFDEIANILTDPNKFEIEPATKDVRIKNDILIFEGELMSEEARDQFGNPFSYVRIDSNGKPLINSRTKLANVSKTIQLFIFKFEAENGTSELLFSAETDRAFENRIKVDPNTTTGGGSVTLQEDEPTPGTPPVK